MILLGVHTVTAVDVWKGMEGEVCEGEVCEGEGELGMVNTQSHHNLFKSKELCFVFCSHQCNAWYECYILCTFRNV